MSFLDVLAAMARGAADNLKAAQQHGVPVNAGAAAYFGAWYGLGMLWPQTEAERRLAKKVLEPLRDLGTVAVSLQLQPPKLPSTR